MNTQVSVIDDEEDIALAIQRAKEVSNEVTLNLDLKVTGRGRDFSGIPEQCRDQKIGSFYFYKGFDNDGGLLCYKAKNGGAARFKIAKQVAVRDALRTEILEEEYPSECEVKPVTENRSLSEHIAKLARDEMARRAEAANGTQPVPRHELLLVGLTDSTGRLQNNIRIATNRANEIKRLLTSARLTDVSAIGRGEEVLMPLVPPATVPNLHDSASRRVDVYACQW